MSGVTGWPQLSRFQLAEARCVVHRTVDQLRSGPGISNEPGPSLSTALLTRALDGQRIVVEVVAASTNRPRPCAWGAIAPQQTSLATGDSCDVYR